MKGEKFCVAALLIAVLFQGCSIRRFAVNRMGDALASGGSTYQSDDDVQLVGDALPFALKLMESLLEEAPRHRGLLQTACQGFATYSYVYVQREAELTAGADLRQAAALRTRAGRFYQRASRYCLRGLEVSYPRIGDKLLKEPRQAIAVVNRKRDVPLLYWSAVALGLRVSVSKNNVAMVARIPEVEALIERALALDESWSEGALHEFHVTFASAKPGSPDYDVIRKHYLRALELSGGKRAGLHVAYAEAAWLPKQNRAEFQAFLDKALAVDPDLHEKERLPNLLARQRAQWLLERLDEVVLESESQPTGEKNEK